jgi:hypothetical protein
VGAHTLNAEANAVLSSCMLAPQMKMLCRPQPLQPASYPPSASPARRVKHAETSPSHPYAQRSSCRCSSLPGLPTTSSEPTCTTTRSYPRDHSACWPTLDTKQRTMIPSEPHVRFTRLCTAARFLRNRTARLSKQDCLSEAMDQPPACETCARRVLPSRAFCWAITGYPPHIPFAALSSRAGVHKTFTQLQKKLQSNSARACVALRRGLRSCLVLQSLHLRFS